MNEHQERLSIPKRAWLQWARDLDYPPAAFPKAGRRIFELRRLQVEIQRCRRCPLASGRKQAVLGVGDPFSPVMFVGEGPGAQEDIEGQPFVGAAGQLLTKVLASVGLARSRLYIANVVKCRPEGNRTPRPNEMEACFPFLKRQIDCIRPLILVPMGNPALQMILGRSGIMMVHGTWFRKSDFWVYPIFHPSFVLRYGDKYLSVYYRDLRQLADVLQAWNFDLGKEI